jgi:hypothetical protein
LFVGTSTSFGVGAVHFSPLIEIMKTWCLATGLLALAGLSCFAAPRVITLEGDVIEGVVESISGAGEVKVGGKQWPLDGLRSIVPSDPSGVEDTSDGRVVLICGSEIAASKIRLTEEEIAFDVPGFGEWKVPIDAVRALRFGELQRGSRFQKGLLEWEASRDFDTVFISGGAELQEVDGLIEELDNAALTFDREGKLQTVPRVRAYGVVLASPLLKENERPACVFSLVGGTRIRADIVDLSGGKVKLALVEGIELEIPWDTVRRVGIRSERLAYLSDLDVEKEGIRPIIAPRREWQRDRTVSGLPIQIGEQTYDKGLGFAAGTFVTFPNDGPYDLFLAEIGIDTDARGLGDCEFVVASGEQVLFRKRMRGGEPAELIKVDISGLTNVTLRVEAGEDLDLADHADWGDACFLQGTK